MDSSFIIILQILGVINKHHSVCLNDRKLRVGRQRKNYLSDECMWGWACVIGPLHVHWYLTANLQRASDLFRVT